MAKNTVVVKQDEESPIPAEIMAQAIVDIAQAAKAISRCGLNRKAIVVLISHNSKLPQYTVELVLNNLEYLEETWLKPRKTA